MIKQFTVRTTDRNQMIDITGIIRNEIAGQKWDNGIIVVFIPHTTAAVTINENADPDVQTDMIYKLEEIFPKNDMYRHGEGNSDAHVKCTLTGASETLILDNGNLVLGTWQGVYFTEFDGPRTRKVFLKFISG